MVTISTERQPERSSELGLREGVTVCPVESSYCSSHIYGRLKAERQKQNPDFHMGVFTWTDCSSASKETRRVKEGGVTFLRCVWLSLMLGTSQIGG